MSGELADKIIKGYDAKKAKRSNFDSSLDDITFYVLPEYESQNSDKRGSSSGPEKTATRPASSAATENAILLGGHLFTNTFSTSRQNYSLRSQLIGIENSDREAKEWLDLASRVSLQAFQNSNFNESYGETCNLFGAYGTGPFSLDWNFNRSEAVFRNHPINGNFYIGEDQYGKVNEVCRLLRYTPAQAIERYGKGNLPEEVIKAYNDPEKSNDKQDYIQSVYPNPDYDPERKDSNSMLYRSIHVHRETKRVVQQKGYRTFPFMCPRFIKVRDFEYGYGSGHLALPTIRELNRAEQNFMDAYEMEAWGSLLVPDEEAVETVEMVPRGVSFVDMTKGAPVHIKGTGNSAILMQRIMHLEQRLSRHFFIDVFLAVSARYGGDKTAREVAEISEEKITSVNGIISRFQSEGISPMVERMVDLLIQAQLLPPPPPSIAGSGFRVVYTSRIDSKLAEVEADQMLRAAHEVTDILERRQAVPSLDTVLKTVDMCADILERRNVDIKHIPSKADRRKIEQAMNEAMQKQEQMQAMQAHVGKLDPNKSPEPGSAAEAMSKMT